MQSDRWGNVKRCLDEATEAVDEKENNTVAIQKLIWAIGWLADEVFLSSAKSITEEPQ